MFHPRKKDGSIEPAEVKTIEVKNVFSSMSVKEEPTLQNHPRYQEYWTKVQSLFGMHQNRFLTDEDYKIAMEKITQQYQDVIVLIPKPIIEEPKQTNADYDKSYESLLSMFQSGYITKQDFDTSVIKLKEVFDIKE